MLPVMVVRNQPVRGRRQQAVRHRRHRQEHVYRPDGGGRVGHASEIMSAAIPALRHRDPAAILDGFQAKRAVLASGGQNDAPRRATELDCERRKQTVDGGRIALGRGTIHGQPPASVRSVPGEIT